MTAMPGLTILVNAHDAFQGLMILLEFGSDYCPRKRGGFNYA